MTAHILAFPSAAPVARALDNARQIGGAVLAFGLALWVLV